MSIHPYLVPTRLWLHPYLWFRCWHAPRVRGTKDNPLTMEDIERLQRLLRILKYHEAKP